MASDNPTLLTGSNGVKDVPVPPTILPSDTSLPSILSKALKEKSEGSDVICALGGVAGPMLSVVHGVACALGVDASVVEKLNLAARMELLRVAKMVNEEDDVTADDDRALDILLVWCATPIVPTYPVGVHLVLADLDEPSAEVASDLAWILKLTCIRAQIDLENDLPLLAMSCRAMLAAESLTEARLLEILDAGTGSVPKAENVQLSDLRGFVEKECASLERQESPASVSSGGLNADQSVSPFVSDMLNHVGDEQKLAPGAAFAWARQCSGELTGSDGFRRQISGYVLNSPTKNREG